MHEPHTKSAKAIRHVAFESLGTFEEELIRAGYAIDYVDAAIHDLSTIDPAEPDLLVVLGGPIGVYETDAYPCLRDELAIVKARLDAGMPLLGICLGAQIVAAAMGANVAPTGVKEIGFASIDLTAVGAQGPLRFLEEVPVLHWHGDAFALPAGADLLATTPAANQAFSAGRNVLGLQFHAEADAVRGLEPWLIGHAAELAGAGIAPEDLRRQAREFGPALCTAGKAMFADWLRQLNHVAR